MVTRETAKMWAQRSGRCGEDAGNGWPCLLAKGHEGALHSRVSAEVFDVEDGVVEPTTLKVVRGEGQRGQASFLGWAGVLP